MIEQRRCGEFEALERRWEVVDRSIKLRPEEEVRERGWEGINWLIK